MSVSNPVEILIFGIDLCLSTACVTVIVFLVAVIMKVLGI